MCKHFFRCLVASFGAVFSCNDKANHHTYWNTAQTTACKKFNVNLGTSLFSMRFMHILYIHNSLARRLARRHKWSERERAIERVHCRIWKLNHSLRKTSPHTRARVCTNMQQCRHLITIKLSLRKRFTESLQWATVGIFFFFSSSFFSPVGFSCFHHSFFHSQQISLYPLLFYGQRAVLFPSWTVSFGFNGVRWEKWKAALETKEA